MLCAPKGHRGFKSHPLRHQFLQHKHHATLQKIQSTVDPGISIEDQTSSQEAVSSKISVSKQTQPVLKATVVRKENLTNGEGKKVDPSSAPSTLSFNMFLYIVDKFKAD